MTYLFDTAFCMEIIRSKPKEVLQRLVQLQEGEGCLSTVTLAQLKEAADKSAYPERNTAAIMQFIAFFDVLPFEDKAAFAYGKVRAAAAKSGVTLGITDSMNAGIALAEELILVTTEPGKYAQIPDLQTKDWLGF